MSFDLGVFSKVKAHFYQLHENQSEFLRLRTLFMKNTYDPVFSFTMFECLTIGLFEFLLILIKKAKN